MKRPETFRRRKRTKAAMKYLAVLLVILLVAGFQDRIVSYSEDFAVLKPPSLLLNASFILTLPVAWACHVAFQRLAVLREIRLLFWKRVAFMLVSTGVQLLLFSVILFLLSDEVTNFAQVLRYLTSALLYQYLLAYSVVAWVLVRREKFQTKRIP